MITIPLQLSDELARRVKPLQDRLPEIIELGLRQVESGTTIEASPERGKERVLAALHSTGIVTLPDPRARRTGRVRHTPIKAGGQPASEIIIEERRKRHGCRSFYRQP